MRGGFLWAPGGEPRSRLAPPVPIPGPEFLRHGNLTAFGTVTAGSNPAPAAYRRLGCAGRLISDRDRCAARSLDLLQKDAQGRVYVSTYPTMMGLIDEAAWRIPHPLSRPVMLKGIHRLAWPSSRSWPAHSVEWLCLEKSSQNQG
jgi:hypothetical protein